MYGSLVNRLSEASTNPEPQVGMGVTIYHYSDRSAGTIVEVYKDYFVVQDDHAKRIDTNGMSESQEYQYSPNLNGSLTIFRRVSRGKRKGQWRERGKSEGNGVGLGFRQKYYDYSF